MSERQALTRVLKQLGWDGDLTPARYGMLEIGLDRFAANISRWRMRGRKHHRVLKRHLAFTIFAPGGQASRARTAVNKIPNHMLDMPRSRHQKQLEVGIRPYVRFHKTKAKHLTGALRMWDDILVQVKEHDPLNCSYLAYNEWHLPDMYRWFQTHVPGLGEKAAAHFMRNAGLCHRWLAIPIIDVHIHKALDAYNFRHEDYKTAAKSFMEFSQLINVPPLMLDAALWCSYANNWELDGADFDNFGFG